MPGSSGRRSKPWSGRTGRPTRTPSRAGSCTWTGPIRPGGRTARPGRPGGGRRRQRGQPDRAGRLPPGDARRPGRPGPSCSTRAACRPGDAGPRPRRTRPRPRSPTVSSSPPRGRTAATLGRWARNAAVERPRRTTGLPGVGGRRPGPPPHDPARRLPGPGPLRRGRRAAGPRPGAQHPPAGHHGHRPGRPEGGTPRPRRHPPHRRRRHPGHRSAAVVSAGTGRTVWASQGS